MAAGVDACKSCSKQFDELKNALKCIQCENFFHGLCEGVPDLRGFHMKRASWKCGACSKIPPSDPKNRKRIRGENGDVIEVDRKLMDNLLSMVSSLTASVKKMENQLSSVISENKKLNAQISTLVRDKQQSVSLSAGSFASVTKSNLVQVESNDTFKSNESDKLFTFGINKQVTSDRQYITAEQVNNAIKSSVAETASAISEEDRFKLIKNRRRSELKERVLKSTLIGSRMCSEGGSLQGTDTLEGSERTKWIYVGRCKPYSTCDMVKKYVESNWNIENVKCVNLFAGEETSSFKVGVPESRGNELLNPEKWPNRVAVREFVSFGRNFQRRNSALPTRSQAQPVVDQQISHASTVVDKPLPGFLPEGSQPVHP